MARKPMMAETNENSRIFDNTSEQIPTKIKNSLVRLEK